MSVKVNLVPGTGKSKIGDCHKKSYFLLLTWSGKFPPEEVLFFFFLKYRLFSDYYLVEYRLFSDSEAQILSILCLCHLQCEVYPRRCAHSHIPERETMTPWEDCMGHALKSHISVLPTSALARSQSLSHT